MWGDWVYYNIMPSKPALFKSEYYVSHICNLKFSSSHNLPGKKKNAKLLLHSLYLIQYIQNIITTDNPYKIINEILLFYSINTILYIYKSISYLYPLRGSRSNNIPVALSLLAPRSWSLKTVLHLKEPALLEERAGYRDEAGEVQDEAGMSCSRKQGRCSEIDGDTLKRQKNHLERVPMGLV